MSEAVQEAGSSGFTIDRSTNTIRFERELPTWPEKVFDAWTEPRQVECWWDPTGVPLEKCDIDLRVGGAFSFSSRTHSDRPFTGVYREISRPNLLVFDAGGAVGRVRLTAVDRGTHMIVEIICSSAEQLEQFIQMGAAVGTSRTLDNLVAFEMRHAPAHHGND